MQIKVKDFAVTMNLGTRGITFDVYDTDGTHVGDLRLGKATIEWCKGRVRAGNGVKVTWSELIAWLES